MATYVEKRSLSPAREKKEEDAGVWPARQSRRADKGNANNFAPRDRLGALRVTRVHGARATSADRHVHLASARYIARVSTRRLRA